MRVSPTNILVNPTKSLFGCINTHKILAAPTKFLREHHFAVGKIHSKVYGALRALNFHCQSFLFELKKKLIQTLAMPHFEYVSVVCNHIEKTRGKYLQVAHNTCIRFPTGYVSSIPTQEVKSHITHCRLKLEWLSLTSRRFLQLHRPRVSNDWTSSSQQHNTAFESRARPPVPFIFKRARTEAWNSSFTMDRYGKPTHLSPPRTSGHLGVRSMGF